MKTIYIVVRAKIWCGELKSSECLCAFESEEDAILEAQNQDEDSWSALNGWNHFVDKCELFAPIV